MNALLHQRLQHSLEAKRRSGLYRQRTIETPHHDSRLSFSSNDYLSLTSDPRLKRAYQEGYAQYAVGSGGSPLVMGYHPMHRQLEQAFSAVLGVDDCLFFSSGYAANLSLTHVLAELDATIYIDKSAHASVYDGMALAGVPFIRHRHCDVDDLRLKMKPDEPSVIITESVFSMSGQMAPLAELSQLAALHDSDLMVDEAHAFGVIGDEGLGLVNELKLTQEQVPLRVIPLGKAFASQGAIIAGHGDWIDALLQLARSYRYSTAPSPAQAYGLLNTLDIVRSACDRRQKLTELIHYVRMRIEQSEPRAEWVWRDSVTPIQQLQTGCPFKAKLLENKLLGHGIYCVPMRYPTVSKKETGLRIILNYHHQPEDIDALFNGLYS